MFEDDRIPCSRSGGPLFARSHNPNVTWAMVVEKAYAKVAYVALLFYSLSLTLATSFIAAPPNGLLSFLCTRGAVCGRAGSLDGLLAAGWRVCAPTHSCTATTRI